MKFSATQAAGDCVISLPPLVSDWTIFWAGGLLGALFVTLMFVFVLLGEKEDKAL